MNSLEGKYQNDVLRGILTSLDGKATTLVVVIPLEEWEGDRRRLQRRLPASDLVDGVIVLSSALRLQHGDIDAIAAFYRGASGRDRVVSVGLASEALPSIVVGDELGVRDAVTHLVKVHGYRRIGFLRGPSNNMEANRRFAAYRQELVALGCFDAQLVSDPADFSFQSGKEATERLLGAWPSGIQALIAANDELAHGALKVIGERPEAQRPGVIGFDDTEYAGAAEPPLTTVRQPLEAEGQLAAKWMLKLHAGERLRHRLQTLGASLQIRESCGCTHAPAARDQVGIWIEQLVPDRRAAIDVRLAFRRGLASVDFLEQEQVATKLLGRRLELATSSDIDAWHQALVGLRNTSLASLRHDHALYERQERFWVNLLERVSRQGSRLALRNEDRRVTLRRLHERAADRNDLAALFEETMDRLELGRFWICAPAAPRGGDAMLELVVGEGQPREFPVPQLLPANALPPAVAIYGLELANPEGPRAGHVVFELGVPNDWWMYNELARVARELCRRRSHRPAGSAEAAGVAAAPASAGTGLQLQSVEEFEDRAGALLNRLLSALRFDSASVQLLDGNAREIVLARGFDKESARRTLLRPITSDPLVSRILAGRAAEFVPDTSRMAAGEWDQPSSVQAWIGAPIFQRGAPIGLLTVDFSQTKPNILDYRASVERFVEEVAPLLAEVRPYVKEHQLAKRTRSVQETMHLLAQKLRPEELLQTIAQEIGRHLNCSHCTLFFPTRTAEGTVLKAEYADGSKRPLTRVFKKGEGFAGTVWETGEHLIIDDVEKDSRFAPARRPSGKRAMLIVPILVADQTIGVISADQDAVGWFSERDAWLVSALAQQAGIAIQRAKAVQFLTDIATSILSAAKSGDILAKVVAHAVALTNANEGVIYHLGDDQRSVREAFPPHSTHPRPRLDEPSGLTRQIILEKRHISIPDLASDPRVNPVLLERWKSMIGVPLIDDQDVVGVLFVNDADRHDFSEPEISLLRILADLAAIALKDVDASPASTVPTLPLDTGSISKTLQAEVSTCVYLYDSEQDRFSSPQAYGPLAEVLEEEPREHGTGRLAIETGKPYYLADVDDPPADPADPGRKLPTVRDRAKTVHSFAALPLHHDGEPVGVLFVASQERLDFKNEERRVLEFFARHLARAVGDSNRYARHKKVARRAIVRISNHLQHFERAARDLQRACNHRTDVDAFTPIKGKLLYSSKELRRLLEEFQRDGEPIKLQRESISLNDVVRRAVKEQREASIFAFTPSQELAPELEQPLPLDGDRLVMCVRELMTNAQRALDEAALSPTPRTMRVFTKKDGSLVTFGVEDDGPGFPLGIDPRILFEGAAPDNLGVGLSIVRAVARAHGGRMIWGNSREKLKGALVSVSLPLPDAHG